eukprot:scaffold4969_cov364-Prasinococcus_capsulatus_cf.AAC.2
MPPGTAALPSTARKHRAPTLLPNDAPTTAAEGAAASGCAIRRRRRRRRRLRSSGDASQPAGRIEGWLAGWVGMERWVGCSSAAVAGAQDADYAQTLHLSPAAKTSGAPKA